MKLSEHKDLKKEILLLPAKEKDKLLLRLIAKDKILTEHLHFTLLEDAADLADRVALIEHTIHDTIANLSRNGAVNAKETLTTLRKLAKLVNHNLKVTKSNFEDVYLRILLFTAINKVIDFKFHRSYKDYEIVFFNYYLKSVHVTLNKFHKLHEDLQFDLTEDINILLKCIHQTKFKNKAMELNIPPHI